MSELIVARSSVPVLVPRADVRVRVATMDDLPFMDGLQKQHSKQLGYFPTKQFEGYVEMGGVLIAEDQGGAPVGYIVWRDRYLKRDELGVVYQLCVVPGVRRGLIGATLLKAVFDRSAYGCRLYCCWCAQDLAANYFWESMGFVPIAFRGGSGKKKRLHIFWQKRIRPGDETTPSWFPAKTEGGAMREDRLVLPIPPQLHWSDPMPVLKAEERVAGEEPPRRSSSRKKSAGAGVGVGVGVGVTPTLQEPTPDPRKRHFASFGPPPAVLPPPAPPPPPPPTPEPAVRVKAPARRVKEKADPKTIALARELRDRWLEQVNEDPTLLLPAGKYDVARALPAMALGTPRQLPAAA